MAAYVRACLAVWQNPSAIMGVVGRLGPHCYESDVVRNLVRWKSFLTNLRWYIVWVWSCVRLATLSRCAFWMGRWWETSGLSLGGYDGQKNLVGGFEELKNE